MLYLAFAIIAIGLLILIISLSIHQKESVPQKIESKENHKKIYTSIEPKNKKNTDENPEPSLAQSDIDPPELSERIIEKQKIDRMDMPTEEPVENKAEDNESHFTQDNVLFYEDNSNLIDYNNDTGTIDSTLKEYKKIKLIGKGKLTLEKNGLSFFIGKKFRRFDFYAIEKLNSGPDYISFLTSKGPIKLFIIKHNTPLISNIVSTYYTSKN